MEEIQKRHTEKQYTINRAKELYSKIQNTVRCTYTCTLLELFICFHIICKQSTNK